MKCRFGDFMDLHDEITCLICHLQPGEVTEWILSCTMNEAAGTIYVKIE